MSGTGYIIGPQIPEGLATIVEGLAREILRHRPTDVYGFAARHFEELMKLREKERNIEIVPQISYLAEETAATKKLTTPFVARNAQPSKRKEATIECGWSIGRTVKVFKKHGFGRELKYVNVKDVKEVKKEQTDKEKKIDYSEIRWGSNRCVRSSSVGDLQGEKIETGEEIEKTMEERKKDARKVKRREYESVVSRRRKDAGEIEGGLIEKADETRGQTVVRRRRRSRSVANDGEQSKRKVSTTEEETRERKRPATATERRSSFRTTAQTESAAQREIGSEWDTNQPRERKKSHPEKNGKESKNNYERKRDEENVVSSSVEKDHSESLIVLPSVVSRQSCKKCTTNEKPESEETAAPHSLVLPPISTDFSKTIRAENDVTLPSLTHGPRTWDDERLNDIVHKKNSWLTEEQDREDEDEIVVLSGSSIVERDAEQTTRHSEEIENLEYSNSREIEQVFKDSLNVTPDSIECSQRSDSLERLQDENESKTVTDHEQTMTDERNESNELKRKLMEIETVEKMIENTLVSSGTAVNSNDVLQVEFPIGFRVDSDTDTVSVTETKEKANLERIERSSVEGVAENVENVDEEDVEDTRNIEQGENNDKDDFQIDEAATVTEPNSAASSNISPVNTDIDRSNVVVSASIPVPLSEYSSAKSDPSCYVLSEGSPCEIPESVTTVIIPDKNIRNDEIFQFEEKEPFGDLVYSEAFEYSTSIDAGVFGEITDAVDRMTLKIEDLENINEEEESERERDLESDRKTKLSSNVSDDLEKRSEDIIPNAGVPDENGKENIEATHIETRCAEKSDETENGTPLSLVESGPYVPELNLDSLRDVTNSCLGISDSVTVEDRFRVTKKRNQQEIGDNSLREGENTLSSFDTLPSEEKASLDEDENGYRDSKTISDRRRQRTDETESRDHRFSPREPADNSSNIEEEIAQELIKNLNLEVPEQFNTDTNDSSLSNSVCTKTNTEERDKGQSLKETEDEDGKNSTRSTETIDRITGEKISNENFGTAIKTQKDQSEADEQRIQSTITLNVASPSTPKHTQKQVGDPKIENGNRGGLWHTSEFHDSLPLPIPHTPKIFSITDDLASSIIRSMTMATISTKTTTTTTTTTATHPWSVVEPNRIGSLRPQQPPPLYYAINLSKDLRSLETKLSFIDSSLNVLPCIVRVEPFVDDTSNANSISFTGNILDSDTDDLREPLALDDEEPKQSIVIEEISTDDEKENDDGR
ncbi:uncharacterized protein LOC105662337 [Megachile rotundata]|uniref:uncharacterized protein LOC105662337 n=1 Tax=Megachile rotundata TaxID=143995 RepID=UPI003FCF3E9C